MTDAPRVRFAPSPTGYFHVGSARAALFNWFFARQRGGTFVLRIEDTDETRNRTEWTEGIISAMSWLGLAPDEGPYFQSAQDDSHQAAIEALWASGALYACACTREEIDARVKARAAAGDPTPGYDGHCRDLGLERGEGRALRFRTPDEGSLRVDDLVRGEVDFPLRALDDFICVRGDGKPLFALANAVDDRSMAISHVIRGEDLLPSTPRQVLLWGALNRAEARELALPSYAHLPLLVNERGKKLSKRRDPVAVELYREQGYLPAAMRNYLALLGWSPGDEEILPVETLVERFRLEDVQKSPAFFDVQKLTHFNGVYIRALSVSEFVDAARPWLDPVPGEWAPAGWHDPDTGEAVVAGVPWPPARYDAARFGELAAVTQERVAMLSEVPALVDFLFEEDAPIDEASWQKAIAGDELAPQILTAALADYAECPWDREALHEVTKEIADLADRKLGKAQAPIRVAVMGRTQGLPLFDSLAVLGRDETRRRIGAALARLAPAG
ncbi:MAG TPA: glutamate--tRNA ligase [Acidimicrobiales bacterium]|jgi:glutamyl-tRNA synthetase|nr:glutamate--tRNA ligase [Acidimicrobiales bacterium]